MLKDLSTVCRELNMPLIKCEVNLILMWSGSCVITSMKKREVTVAQRDNSATFGKSPTGATFNIADAKLYVAVVTPPNQDNNKILQHLRTGFK